jgi:thiol-disulfide isomerase/thioredoxin
METVASTSKGTSNRTPPAPPRAGRRRWLRLVRNLVLLGAVYLAFTQTFSKRPRLAQVSQEAWNRELAARRGSVVVVPVWASWCQSCIKMLPAMAAISERYAANGVLFVSLCLDDYTRDQDIDAAEKIVIAREVRFPHFLPKQDIAESLESLTLGDLPAVLVYDRTGELRYRLEGDRWTNEISLADVEDAVESLL